MIDEGTVSFPNHIKVSTKIIDLMKRMLVKDHFRRITWEELFDYDLTPTACDKTKLFNPFSKKNYNTNHDSSITIKQSP